MGAWGTEPFQNDNALDWLVGIEDELLDRIIQTLRQAKPKNKRGSGYHEAIAAAALLNKLSTFTAKPNIGYIAYPDVFEEAKSTLRMILQQTDWVNTWNRPENARDSLKRLIRSLDLRQGERRRTRKAHETQLVTVKLHRQRRSAAKSRKRTEPAKTTSRESGKNKT